VVYIGLYCVGQNSDTLFNYAIILFELLCEYLPLIIYCLNVLIYSITVLIILSEPLFLHTQIVSQTVFVTGVSVTKLVYLHNSFTSADEERRHLMKMITSK